MAKKDKPHSYDAMIARLQEIVELMDSDQAPLEQSIALYDEGITILEKCVSELQTAETRLKELRRRADGLFELVLRDDPQ